MKPTSAAIVAVVGSLLLLVGTNPAEALSIVRPLSGINLFPQGNYHVDINAAHENAANGLGSLYGSHGLSRAYGTVSLFPKALTRIQEELGDVVMMNPVVSNAVRQVQTLRLTQTSARHTDCEMDGSHKKIISMKPNALQTGFLFQNTNEDAYFETDDGGLCIPVVEGNFVYFDGRMPHRSVVKSGHIDMFGPFLLSGQALSSVAMALVLQGKFSVLGDNRRHLSTDNSSEVEGTLMLGDITDREKYPVGDYFLKLNVIGLSSNCTDCAIAIGLANSRECTMDVHDNATKIVLPKETFFTTDDKGSTNGWDDSVFEFFESDNPSISMSEVFSYVNVAAGTLETDLAPVVFLYNNENMHVACAFLESPTDDEKEEFDKLFNGEQDDTPGAAESLSVDTAGSGGNGSSGSVALLPRVAMGVIMTSCAAVILSSL